MKIAVIGDFCFDIFCKGTVDRLNPEAPVGILSAHKQSINVGMAGNTMRNLKALLPEAKIYTCFPNEKSTKIRFVDEKSGYILLRVDNDKRAERIEVSSLNLSEIDIVVISDYGKGFLSEEDIEHISKSNKVFLDTKKTLGEWSKEVFCVKINKKEYLDNQRTIPSPEKFCKNMIVTLGPEGARFINAYDEKHYDVEDVDVVDVAGCGDTFLAALVAEYSRIDELSESIPYANKAARLAATRRGVVTIKKEELE